MRVQHVGYRLKGFYRLASDALRWGMLGHDAHQRLAILRFWQRHGATATREAFKVSTLRKLPRWLCSSSCAKRWSRSEGYAAFRS